jgi:predicted GNAT family N-acyltransferase
MNINNINIDPPFRESLRFDTRTNDNGNLVSKKMREEFFTDKEENSNLRLVFDLNKIRNKHKKLSSFYFKKDRKKYLLHRKTMKNLILKAKETNFPVHTSRLPRLQLDSLFNHMQSVSQPSEIVFTHSISQAPSFSIQKTYSKEQVSEVASKVYSDFCQKRYVNNELPLALQNDYVNSLAMKSVVLPAVFNRNIFICPPIPQESKKIIKHFYVDDFAIDHRHELNNILSNQGYLQINGETHRIVVLKDSSASHTLGAIHFRIIHQAERKFYCVIQSLKVGKAERGKGYGKLLLAFAIKIAKENECNEIKLKSSDEAKVFYSKFGFRADSKMDDSLEEWQNLEHDVKESILQDCDNQMILEFNDPLADELIEEQIESAMQNNSNLV